MGLSFSVKSGITLPPSLTNIFKELVNDINLNFTGGSKEEFSEDSDKMIDNINGILNPEQSKDFKINFFKLL